MSLKDLRLEFGYDYYLELGLPARSRFGEGRCLVLDIARGSKYSKSKTLSSVGR